MKTLLAVALALVLAAPVLAGDQDFTLVNSTGILIDKVFVSPHDVDDWGDDILGRDILADGESVEIRFHRDENATHWDLKVVDKEGTTIEWEDLELPKINKITLDYDDKKPSATVE